MPTPRRAASGAKLSIELLPSTVNPVPTDVDSQVVSSQISTVGRTSNFYVQVMPSKPVEKFEPLPMSYVVLTNGRITLTGEFTIQPTKECKIKTKRDIQPEVQRPPVCVFNGTLPIQITRTMMPYSTLLVYSFQPSFGFNLAESYRFSVAGLFQSPLVLNATIVPYTSPSNVPEDEFEEIDDESSSEDIDLKSVSISARAQDKTRVQLSFTGTPGSTVGLNVIEYDGVIQGLSNEITKERVLQYLTTYEQVPLVGMPTKKDLDVERTEVQPRGFDQSGEMLTSTMDSEFETTTLSNKKRGINDESEETTDSPQEKRVHKVKTSHKTKVSKLPKVHSTKTSKTFHTRTVVSEDEEEEHMVREQMVCQLVLFPIFLIITNVVFSCFLGTQDPLST